MQLLIPLAGLIDKEQELKRLKTAIEKARAEVNRLNNKLANENFVAKAPAKVVQVERDKQQQAQNQLEQLNQQQQKIAAL